MNVNFFKEQLQVLLVLSLYSETVFTLYGIIQIPKNSSYEKKLYDPSDIGMLVLYSTRNIKLSETPVLTAM